MDNVNYDNLFDELLDYFLNGDKKIISLVQRGIKSKEELFAEVYEYLTQKRIAKEDIIKINDKFEKYLWGYYKLDELIEDEYISDIKVLDSDNIRVKRLGKRKNANIKFKDQNDYKKFVESIAIKNKINLSDLNAQQTFTDKTSSDKFILRFSISTDYVNSTDVPYLHIRKLPKKKYTLEELVDLGMLNAGMAEYLNRKVRNSSGILICGKGSAGKTYLLNALIECIPHECSGLIVQENEELFSNTHPDLMFQHVVSPRGESRIRYTLKELATTGLISDIDYFIIGEIKGDEAKPFLNMANTGNMCMATTHANSSKEGLDKVASYANYNKDFTKGEALKMLSSMSVVIFLKDFKIVEVSEIKGWDEDKQNFIYESITL